jgi:hypothetical protein
LQYYLKESVSIGDVTLEIMDPFGKLVKTLPGTIRKGVNKITWDLKMSPPKVAGGGTKIDYSAFVAPMVMPGEYTAKLKIGDKEYTRKLSLVHDAANKDFSLEDRQVQYKTAMQLYHMHEELANTVDSINLKEKMLKENIERISNSESKKLLQDYYSKLEDLRSTLLATKQKSIFADEKKLRENISDVYIAVATQETRPSNLQIQRVNGLKEQAVKAETSRNTLSKEYDNKIITVLTKEGLYPPKEANKMKVF